MVTAKGISIIIPTYNERDSLPELARRIDVSMKKAETLYEMIIIDDHSEDGTLEVARSLQTQYPVHVYSKQGKKGKAFSLLEGFTRAQYDICSFIDADLQYPPEAISKMAAMIGPEADIVVAERSVRDTSWLRALTSNSFRLLCGSLLHGLDCDVQSGLKVFRTEIVRKCRYNPTPWTFDLEFLIKARSAGYKIETYDIVFSERTHGQSKVHLLKTSYEIAAAAVRVKYMSLAPPPQYTDGSNPDGNFEYNNKTYRPYSRLNLDESAVVNVSGGQKIIMLIAAISFLLLLIINWKLATTLLLTGIIFLYFADLLFISYTVLKSLTHNPVMRVDKQSLDALSGPNLPRYTIFCPLYQESQVLSQFTQAIEQLDYPKNKLQVLLLLEEDDQETIRHAQLMNLPSYFEITVVPDSLPKTKPKACNYGLLQATGDYAVIYDAEDIPEPAQLKKVVHAFQTSPEEVVCIQAKLNYYNPEQNILTRMFTIEYSLWFELTLTGLQAVGAPIPLGGTSNHFKTRVLRELHGWDAFNVTEDCDLGIRLAKQGLRTAMVDSLTLEEANSDLSNWVNQRTRWIKGYIQTYMIHIRNQWATGRMSFPYWAFHLIVGGKVVALFINPLMWVLSIAYFAFRPVIGETIESLFHPAIFYAGFASLAVGNFIYLYLYMVGAAAQEQYHLIKFSFLVPVYWLLMSIAAYMALYRFIIEPHYWFKTKHGLHLQFMRKPLAYQSIIPSYGFQSVQN